MYHLELKSICSVKLVPNSSDFFWKDTATSKGDRDQVFIHLALEDKDC